MWNFRKLLFWLLDLCLHAILHLLSKFHTYRPTWRRNTEEKILNMASDRHLEFAKFRFLFVKWSSSEWKFLRYGHKAVFKMAAVTYICMWFFISDPNFTFKGNYCAEIEPKNNFQYGGRTPSWIWKIFNFCQTSILGMEICISIPDLIVIG